MHTREEYRKARIQLEADSSLLKKLTAAVSWASLGRLAEMAGNPESEWWEWDYSHFCPAGSWGYEYGDGYGARVRRSIRGFELRSCGGHAIVIEFGAEEKIVSLNTGTEKSQYSFGGDFSPEERVAVVAERLNRAGFEIGKNATTICLANCRQLKAVSSFLERGPERPATRVKKALNLWPREVVMAVAAEMWPLSFKEKEQVA